MANIAQHDHPRLWPAGRPALVTPSPATLDWAAASDPGRTRTHNEDSWCARPDLGVFVLADGMGGYNAGEVASALAVATVVECLVSPPTLAHSDNPTDSVVRAIALSNEAILACAARRPECLGMGTTIAIVALARNRAVLAHVGDSRIYLQRSGELHRLTRDHSVGQAMVDAGLAAGDSAKGLALRGVLTRALGVGGAVDPDVSVFDTRPGDRLLLCSDGLTDLVPEETICGLMGWGERPDATAQRLIDAALDAGGFDNITALVVDVGAATPER
jgi:protein phosphatase